MFNHKRAKKYPTLAAAQQVSFDTVRASLALECDPFEVIEEVLATLKDMLISAFRS